MGDEDNSYGFMGMLEVMGMVICLVLVFFLVTYFVYIKPTMEKNRKEDEKKQEEQRLNNKYN